MRAFALAAAVVLSAGSGPARALDAPLSLAEAQRRAVELSRQIPAQDAAIAAARDLAIAAGRLPDPMLRLGIDNLPADGPDQFSLTRDFMTMRRVGIAQEITRSEKRELRSLRYGLEAEKSRAEKTAAIAAIERDTALAWLERYYAEAMTAVVTRQVGEIRLEITAAESAYRAGRGTQADVFAAHGAMAALEDRISEFSRRVATAQTGLARWIGDDAGAALDGKPEIEALGVDSSALEAQLGHHPEITTLSRQADVAAMEARIAQADKKADWTVELSYAQRGPAYSNMISIGVSVPLQWDQRNRQDREVASRQALAERASALRDDALRAHVAEVRAMLLEWRNGLERTGRYRHQLIPLAQERTRAALAAYVAGKASLNDILLARRNSIDVQLQALQLELEVARLWAQLNFFVPTGTAHGDNAPRTAVPKEAR
jgi:outer membrane protein TolC